MAIYYMNVKIIGRSSGRSATGAAAYRAGERIHDERTGQTYDYTRRRGEIETEILSPAGAPAWAQDRSLLWNEVEKAERRADAQVAREIVVAFPVELTPAQQRELLRFYAQAEFVSKGMVADVAIHRNPGNPHAHIMLTMREMEPDGLSSKKNREWNKPEQLERWREQWAEQTNRALERAGHPERIDHRSLAEQGLDRLPQVHLGPHAASLEKRGIPTENGDHNRLVAEHNGVVIDLEQARAEKKALEQERTTQTGVASLVQTGWHPDHAKAMVEVERQHGGRRLDPEDLRRKYDTLRSDFQRLHGNIERIEHEDRRLTQAARALEAHQKAQEELGRLQGPLGSLRRFFSRAAREEHDQLIDRVKWTGRRLRETDVIDDQDLKAQRAKWQQETETLPTLRQQAEELKVRADLYYSAFQGQEYEQQRHRLKLEHARTPDREIDSRCMGRQRRRDDRDMDRGR